MDRSKTIVPAARQVAELLLEDLKKSTWTKTLPGMKALANRYGVSHQTVDSSMHYLQEWGWIKPAEPRKPREIIKQSKTKVRPIKNLLILHPEETPDGDSSIFLRNQLAHRWGNKYDRSFIVSVGKVGEKSIKQELDRYIYKYGADAIVLNNLSYEWGMSALHTDLPSYFCGGGLPAKDSVERERTNGFCASFPKELSNAYKMLRKLGHERILFASSAFGLKVKRIILGLEESPKSTDKLIGLPEDYCVQVSSADPSAWMQMWQREIPRLNATAIITVDACAIPSFYSYCQQAGKSIPADHSIMSFEHVKELEYLLPRPLMAHYDFKGHCDHFEKWVNTELKHIGLKFSDYEWDIHGKSIAKAKAE